jgi:hypothetical protein
LHAAINVLLDHQSVCKEHGHIIIIKHIKDKDSVLRSVIYHKKQKYFLAILFSLQLVGVKLTYVPITIYEIGRTHPIGKVRGGKIQVIARFSTYHQRNVVFSAKRDFKGYTDNIFITETFTPRC